MSHNEREQQQLQELLLPNHQKDYFNDGVPRTTNIGWLKNYFRGHFLPSIKRKIFIIMFFSIFLLILLNSQQSLNGDDSESESINKSDAYPPKNEDDYDYFPSDSEYEKFMTYLPYGNVFQQREELENATFLAYSLNRTLIIPPLILGLDIEFTTSQELQEKLELLRSNKHRSECFVKTFIPEQKETKYEIDMNCLKEFESYSLLRWDSLFNLDRIKSKIRVLHRKDFDHIKLEKMLNITNLGQDVYEITKSSLDNNLITLDSIRSHKEKLLSFDYLSGNQLIDKSSSQNLLFLSQIDSSLNLYNPVIFDTSKKIIEKLGGIGNYIGVHARLLSYPESFIEESFSNLTITLKNYFKTIPTSSQIIYLATDLNRNNTILSPLLSQFPHVTMLKDYNEIIVPLLNLYNPRDGTLLFKFLEPFVNSIVASTGVELFTLDDGIYSEYAKRLHKNEGR